MAQPKEYIGTGEELKPYLEQQPKQRFRLIPILGETELTDETANGAEASDQKQSTQPEKTLAEMFAGRVGRVSFDPPDVAARSEEYFGKIVSDKHKKHPVK